jgi:tripartite-type tricarboxylate transporter receptor subunit TctC
MRTPEMAEAMKSVGVEEALSTPEEFGRIIESEMNRWGKLVRSLNLHLE